jgi:anthranilate synthase component 1
LAKKHCQRGDVFQIVLSRRFSQQFKGDDFNLYRALRSINPSPYLFYFDYGNFKIFGSSPEAQIVVKNEIAEIHPIAGTFRRTGDDEQDKALALKLSADQKENSEHVMLVDLARNDLSRNGSDVKVGELPRSSVLFTRHSFGLQSNWEKRNPKFQRHELSLTLFLQELLVEHPNTGLCN